MKMTDDDKRILDALKKYEVVRPQNLFARLFHKSDKAKVKSFKRTRDEMQKNMDKNPEKFDKLKESINSNIFAQPLIDTIKIENIKSDRERENNQNLKSIKKLLQQNTKNKRKVSDNEMRKLGGLARAAKFEGIKQMVKQEYNTLSANKKISNSQAASEIESIIEQKHPDIKNPKSPLFIEPAKDGTRATKYAKWISHYKQS